MRLLAGTIEAAREQYPELYRRHGEVCKMLEKVRRIFRQEAKEEMREEYYDTMPTIEVDKQIDQLLGNRDADPLDTEDENEDWNPPIPEYMFQERARIVEAFYGPEAETLEGDLALARRIQVTKDMVALCGLWEPNRRGKSFNWNKDDDSDNELKQEEDPLLDPDADKCPTDICIICLGSCRRSGRRPRKFRRIDSLRRHLIDLHFNRLAEGTGVRCTLDTCKNEEAFVDVTMFLHHAATAHDYDLKIGPHHLKRRRRTCSADALSVNDLAMDSTTDSTIDSMADVTMSGTQTPASSVDSDVLLNIDPRLLDRSGGGREN